MMTNYLTSMREDTMAGGHNDLFVREQCSIS